MWWEARFSLLPTFKMPKIYFFEGKQVPMSSEFVSASKNYQSVTMGSQTELKVLSCTLESMDLNRIPSVSSSEYCQENM